MSDDWLNPKPRTPRVEGVDDLIRELRLFNHHKSADMLDLLATSLQWQADERVALVKQARRAQDERDSLREDLLALATR